MSTAPTHNTWSEPLTKPIEQLGIYLAIIPDFVEGSKRWESGFVACGVVPAGADGLRMVWQDGGQRLSLGACEGWIRDGMDQ
jgi:hypothetical protein